jgi:hypothetical protein
MLHFPTETLSNLQTYNIFTFAQHLLHWHSIDTTISFYWVWLWINKEIKYRWLDISSAWTRSTNIDCRNSLLQCFIHLCEILRLLDAMISRGFPWNVRYWQSLAVQHVKEELFATLASSSFLLHTCNIM